MSELVRIQNLVKYYGNTLVLNGINLTISAGDRMVLVGENGAGKSTLMRLVVGELTADSGLVKIREGLGIGYLPQETHLTDLSLTITQFLSQAVGDLESIQAELSRLEGEMANPEADLDAILEAYGTLQTLFEERGGYDLEHRFNLVLSGLGLTDIGLERVLSSLSGGEKRRVALAGLLLQSPQLLILDEPTNHLDFEALSWLEGYLKNYPNSMVVISHDRRFINSIVNVIAELSPKDKQLTFYHGNYEFYLAERERAFQKRVALWEEQHAEKRQLEQLIKKEAFARGGGKAPSDGDKMQFKKKIATSEKTAAKAIQNAKQRLAELERDMIPRPTSRWSVNPNFDPTPLHSQELIRLKGLSKGFGERSLFEDVDLTVYQGDRVVLIAPNGSGKSTLIRIIMGQIGADGGEVYLAPAAVIGYLDQEQTTLNFEHTVLEEYQTVVDGTESELRSDLHRYALFEGDQVNQTVRSLSDGQRQRLQLAKIAAQRANLLLLDEPTNHLDLVTLERLEEAYQGFEGTMLVVSHDRWFVEKVATRIWRLEGTKVVEDSL